VVGGGVVGAGVALDARQVGVRSLNRELKNTIGRLTGDHDRAGLQLAASGVLASVRELKTSR
jgi:hypothetical protein